MWKYESPIGTLCIQKLDNGRYGLIYNGTIWESCHTPQAEADNVYMYCTGCYDCDSLDGQVMDVPSDLSGWKILIPSLISSISIFPSLFISVSICFSTKAAYLSATFTNFSCLFAVYFLFSPLPYFSTSLIIDVQAIAVAEYI